MALQFRDLEKQYQVLKDQLDAALIDARASATYIGGPHVSDLEEQLADYVGVKHCISCANGTDALQLALMVWGVGPDDAVFVPDFTFFSSGEVVSAVGATPFFVDVDKETYNIDTEALDQAINFVEECTKLTPKVVVAVDLFGLPADYPKIRSVCKQHRVLLLEDGAQGFGGSIGDKMACSFGDISTTSFFPAKPLGCFGDGGAVFTDDDEWASLLRSYAVHGKGSMKYDNVRIGMNSRLDALQAAILQVKLEAFSQREVDAVNEVACAYTDGLSDFAAETGTILPFVPAGFRSSWAQYTVQLPDSLNRSDLQMLLKKQNIPTMVYYPKPMHDQTAFEGKCLCPTGCSVTVELCRTVLSLPMGPYLEHANIQFVCEKLAEIGLR